MKQLLQVGLIVLSFVVLWLDIVTPLGLAIWLLYYVILALVSNTVNPVMLFVFATFNSVLIIIGAFVSLPLEGSLEFALENRISAIIVLWILTYTLYKNHIFASKLQQRTSELINANRDLESFSYSISHDLKNPLTVISGFSRMLQNTANEKLDSDERLSIEKIVSESDRMGFLIADLLRLSRVGNQELKTETVNLSNIAQESYNALVVPHNIENNPYPDFTV